MHKCVFYVTYTPIHPLSPFLLLSFTFLGLFFPQWCTCGPSTIWNGLCMKFEPFPLWALLGQLLARARPGGGGGLRTPKWFYRTVDFLGVGGNVLN